MSKNPLGGHAQKMIKSKTSGIEEVGCSVTLRTEIVMGQNSGMSFFDQRHLESPGSTESRYATVR